MSRSRLSLACTRTGILNWNIANTGQIEGLPCLDSLDLTARDHQEDRIGSSISSYISRVLTKKGRYSISRPASTASCPIQRRKIKALDVRKTTLEKLQQGYALLVSHATSGLRGNLMIVIALWQTVLDSYARAVGVLYQDM